MEGARDNALLRVLRDTGMRRGECVALTLGDVDLDERTVTIRPSTSKTRTGRTVPIAKDTTAFLRAYLRARTAYKARTGREDDGRLWWAQKGSLTPTGLLQAVWRRCDKAAVARVSVHAWRHRMAARAIQQGLPGPLIESIAGWQSSAMLSRYGTWERGTVAVSAMRALLDGATR